MTVETVMELKAARRPIKMLLIDDNKDFADLAAMYLEDSLLFEYIVTYAECFKDAATELTKNVFDVVILDLNLKNGRGLKLVSWIRKIYPRGPLIVCTGLPDHDVEIEAIGLHATEFFFKSEFDNPKDFQQVVRRAMKRDEVQQMLTRMNGPFKDLAHAADRIVE